MPEGVEVTLFANSLHSFLNGKSLVDIEILSGRYIKKLPENFLEFKRDIPLCINEVKNKVLSKFKNTQSAEVTTKKIESDPKYSEPTKEDYEEFDKVFGVN